MALLVVIGAALLHYGCLTPSVDMRRYAQHFAPPEMEPAAGAVTVTFLGTSSLLFDDGKTQLMVDAFLSRPRFLRAAFRKIETDTRVVDTILDRVRATRVRALFIAHTHYDHAFDLAYVVQRTGAHLYGSLSTLNVGYGGGLTEDQMTPFWPGEEVPIGDFTVIVLKSAHGVPFRWIDDIGQEVAKPLSQPAHVLAYKEGGTYDFLIRHRSNTILVKPSTNFLCGALDGLSADVLLLGTGELGKQDASFREWYYAQTVDQVHPRLVIPIHWDNFFKPLTDHLQAPPRLIDNTAKGLDFLLSRTKRDGIDLRLLQGFQTLTLFPVTGPEAEPTPAGTAPAPRPSARQGAGR